MNAKTVDERSIVYVVDDDPSLRDGIRNLFRSIGVTVECFGSTTEFLQFKRPEVPSCLLLDVRLPDMSGLEFQANLDRFGVRMPIVFMTGHADVPMGVQAIKGGAIEFLCKPFREEELLDAVRIGLKRDSERRKADDELSKIQAAFATLTPREREVMGQVVTGLMNKQIASNLEISQITVKVHRGSVMLMPVQQR